MHCYDLTEELTLSGPSAVTLGKFDGVHRGHQKLMKHVLGICRDEALESVVCTISGRSEGLLLTPAEQEEAVRLLGIDTIVRCPLTERLSHMTPDEFVSRILKEHLHAAHVVIGTDFCFGYRRSGSAAWLKDHEKEYDLDVVVLEKELYGSREISSTYIREALAAHDMPLAQALMGRPYTLNGTVVHGRRVGHDLGYPTANLRAEPSKLLPPDGVYISRTWAEGQWYRSMTDIGVRPTFADTGTRSIETALLDADLDLYGHSIRVELLSYLRPEQSFADAARLRDQLRRDEESVRAFTAAGSEES